MSESQTMKRKKQEERGEFRQTQGKTNSAMLTIHNAAAQSTKEEEGEEETLSDSGLDCVVFVCARRRTVLPKCSLFLQG